MHSTSVSYTHLDVYKRQIYLVAIVLTLFDQRHLAAWAIALLSLTSIPAALGSALIRWRQGFFPAQLYLYGYGLVLGSVGILLLRTTGVLQPAQWNAYVFPVAVAAESILFSFALAYRIQILKQERDVYKRQWPGRWSTRCARGG